KYNRNAQLLVTPCLSRGCRKSRQETHRLPPYDIGSEKGVIFSGYIFLDFQGFLNEFTKQNPEIRHPNYDDFSPITEKDIFEDPK
ncbi:unnamed protein product, partial [marine sediment metagenome]